MRADFRADGLHHFVHVRETREILADRGEKLEVQFRPPAPGHVARDSEQALGLAVRVENRRNPHVPPFGFTAQRAVKADEVSCPARRPRRDRRARRLTVAALPKLDPRFVQVRPDVFDAEQRPPIHHGEQIAIEIEDLDAVRAAFHNAAVELFARLQRFFRVFALDDFQAHLEVRRVGGIREFMQAHRPEQQRLIHRDRPALELRRLVGRRGKRAHAEKLPQILSVELAAVIVGDHPDRADRFPLDVKWNQQAFFDRRRHRLEIGVTPFGVLE